MPEGGAGGIFNRSNREGPPESLARGQGRARCACSGNRKTADMTEEGKRRNALWEGAISHRIRAFTMKEMGWHCRGLTRG